MDKKIISLSLANPEPVNMNGVQKLSVGIGFAGLFIFVLALLNINFPYKAGWLYGSIVFILAGIIIYSISTYKKLPEGIQNNGVYFKSISSKGLWGWVTGIVLTALYIFLYWYPEYLGMGKDGTANKGLVGFFDPLSYFLNGHAATQWFVYGTLYTMAIVGFGYKFILKYRHNKYQLVRTISVMFFQLGFAFLIPEILAKLNPTLPYFSKDIKNMWPLNYYFFEDWHLKGMLGGGNLGMFMLLFGLAMIFIISPILTYFYGKRWYCSWVCGCGGLAETAGDPFRHLSTKKLGAWKFERWCIHFVLVFIVLTTIAVLYTFLGDPANKVLITRNQFTLGVIIFLSVVIAAIFIFRRKQLDTDSKFTLASLGIIVVGVILINFLSGQNNILFIDSYQFRSWYGFAIGSAFSGVIGVGFYPLMGSRVWCRFGCPMAAILGLQQKLFSRFRITTNGGQCISCGNCSTYCEMGIDVRAYAQKGENIVRSSCVGCGICAAVCPRGVLKLENGDEKSRFDYSPILIEKDNIKVSG
ncbi:MAG: 4Fe-4S binding protein [Ferruginibacter sp.]|nr:4Fe-4S binding protein [Ferruginibacter sp.]